MGVSWVENMKILKYSRPTSTHHLFGVLGGTLVVSGGSLRVPLGSFGEALGRVLEGLWGIPGWGREDPPCGAETIVIYRVCGRGRAFRLDETHPRCRKYRKTQATVSGRAWAAAQGYLILSRQDPILQAMFGEQSRNASGNKVETKWKQ